MSYARTSVKGIIFCNSYQAFNGFTLFTPVDGTGVWLIDMRGNIVHQWEMSVKPAGYVELLPNGHLLFAGKHPDCPLSNVEGAGGILLEVDWDGNIKWKYEDPCLHDSFYRKDNGNTLVIKWVKIPNRISGKIEGSILWGDTIQEITQNGSIQWSWTAHEHLDPKLDISCPICPRIDGPHANGCIELPNGNILITFWKNNEIVIIDRATGDISWRWGNGQLTHPYAATLLDNGNILIFDSGYHQPGIDLSNSRILEVNPQTNDIVWHYKDGENSLFYSSTISNCQRLPNSNTLICEGSTGRIFEVTLNGELAWEYVNDLPFYHPPSPGLKHCKVFVAKPYEADYSGLKTRVNSVEKKQSAPGVEIEEEIKEGSNSTKEKHKSIEKFVYDRLHNLGY